MPGCPRCGHREHSKEKTPGRAYRGSGLPRVRLHHTEVARCLNCGWLDDTFPDIAGLHDAIVRAVMAKRARLAPAEIRFLRKQLGWSGLELSIYMGSTPETVSRWENGRTPMGTTADRLLRLLVAVRLGDTEFSSTRFRMVARWPVRDTRIDIEWREGQWRPVLD